MDLNTISAPENEERLEPQKSVDDKNHNDEDIWKLLLSEISYTEILHRRLKSYFTLDLHDPTAVIKDDQLT